MTICILAIGKGPAESAGRNGKPAELSTATSGKALPRGCRSIYHHSTPAAARMARLSHWEIVSSVPNRPGSSLRINFQQKPRNRVQRDEHGEHFAVAAAEGIVGPQQQGEEPGVDRRVNLRGVDRHASGRRRAVSSDECPPSAVSISNRLWLRATARGPGRAIRTCVAADSFDRLSSF